MHFDPDSGDRRGFAIIEFGARLRRSRLTVGLSQAALGDRCGCSQSTISRVEHGRVPNMPLRQLIGILTVLEAYGNPPGSLDRRTRIDERLSHLVGTNAPRHARSWMRTGGSPRASDSSSR